MVRAEGLLQAIERSFMPITVVARRAGISRHVIYMVREGRPIELHTAIRLARALAVPIEEISEEAARILNEAVAV